MGNCCGGKKVPGDSEPKRRQDIETKEIPEDEETPAPAVEVEEPLAESVSEPPTPVDYGSENDSNYKPSTEEYDTPDDEPPTPPPESFHDLGSEVAKNFNGKIINAAEAKLAREWNQRASTGEYDKLNYRQYRKQMSKFGLPGKNWHVGHIVPNEKGTGRDIGPEDLGWNLMALDAQDNRRLKDTRVPEAMLKFWHRG